MVSKFQRNEVNSRYPLSSLRIMKAVESEISERGMFLIHGHHPLLLLGKIAGARPLPRTILLRTNAQRNQD